jgi:hypothetical protein
MTRAGDGDRSACPRARAARVAWWGASALVAAIAAVTAIACHSGGELTPPLGLSAARTFLVLGNSITTHAPAPALGWSGAWGMAASDSARDFAHRLVARFPGAALTAVHVADIERRPLDYDLRALDSLLAPRPDVVVIQLGDNATDRGAFVRAYGALIAHVTARTDGAVVCVGTWWGQHAAVDAAIRAACAGPRARYVDLGPIAAAAENHASAERRFADAGVGDHPGDAGMGRIADAVYAVLTR